MVDFRPSLSWTYYWRASLSVGLGVLERFEVLAIDVSPLEAEIVLQALEPIAKAYDAVE